MACLASCAGLAALGACGGGDRISIDPPAPTPTPMSAPTPTPGPTTGRIDNLTAARDIVRYNQDTPFNPRRVICRWELPVRVYIEPPTRRDLVIEALDHWKAFADTEYMLVDSPAVEPVLHVREDRAGVVPNGASGVGGVESTYANNRARRGFVIVRPDRTLRKLYRHEVGHALGFFEHPEEPGLMCTFGGCRDEVTPREGSMMAHLYQVPHGARLSTDGSWELVLRDGPTFVAETARTAPPAP